MITQEIAGKCSDQDDVRRRALVILTLKDSVSYCILVCKELTATRPKDRHPCELIRPLDSSLVFTYETPSKGPFFHNVPC